MYVQEQAMVCLASVSATHATLETEPATVRRVRRRRRDMQIMMSDLAAYAGLTGSEIEFPDPSPGPQGLLLQNLFWEDTMRALHRLPPLEEAVFTLRCLQEHSTQDVAHLLGRTEDSVASALKRARRQMRLLLERQGSDLGKLSSQINPA